VANLIQDKPTRRYSSVVVSENPVFRAPHDYTQVGGDMFGLFSKRKNLTVHDVGRIIERFLGNSLRYSQEWNDFVDIKQRKPESERLRRRCYDLDPLVNRPGDIDESALAELRSIAASARKETYLDVAKMLEDFVDGTGGQWDWDDYTSAMSYPDDPYLQEVQQRMMNLDTEISEWWERLLWRGWNGGNPCLCARPAASRRGVWH
jgi:hypothetical protein